MRNNTKSPLLTASARRPAPPRSRRTATVLATADRPVVQRHGGRRVVFGAGLDDFNEVDDPC